MIRSIILLLMCCNHLAAQTKVLGRPIAFENPIDFFEKPTQYQHQINKETRQKSKKEAWFVTSDRDDNPVYKQPNMAAEIVGKLHFRDYFYVLDEKEDWIQLVEAQVDQLKIVSLKKIVGWIPKNKMLLWNSGIIGQNTLIHKKALLLNRADDIKNILKLENSAVVKIYRSPEVDLQDPNRTIFEFYFILKKENGRFLLSEEAIISPFSIEKIVGWVDNRRCSAWDNRVCLEPNFDENAFAERKANPRFKLRAFQDEASAQLFAQTNQPETHVFWQDDPVDRDVKKRAASNNRRYNGYVLRFPMLGVSSKIIGKDTFSYYRSGIVGSIKVRRSDNPTEIGFNSEIIETDFARIKNYVNELDRKTENINIFFVIEGTDSVFGFRNSIAQSMRDVQLALPQDMASARFGALFFRDIPEESVLNQAKTTNRLVESMPLTTDCEKVVAFIQSADFKNRKDRDDYSALYFGLEQSLATADFHKNELNIIILIGNYGDYRADKDRKASAKSQKHKTYMEDFTQIFENINAVDAHFYAVQLRREDTRPCDAFAKQTEFLTLEAAKFAYNKYYGNRQNPQTRTLLDRLQKDYKMVVDEPSIANLTETNDAWLIGGRSPSRIFRPTAGRYLTPNLVSKIICADISASLSFERNLKKIVSDVFIKGNNLNLKKIEEEFHVNAGDFAPALAEWLNQIVQDDAIAQQDLMNALHDKYKLYTEVYLPHKIKDAQFPTVQYVLFMPESDLNVYLRVIMKTLGGAESSYDKKRERLFEIYQELLIQFSGENVLRKRKADDFTRSELLQIMQGLYGSGLRLDIPLDVRLGDIRNEKKVTNAQIDALFEHFKKVEINLSNILRLGDQYDFCFSTDASNRYYWIALSDAF